MSTSWLVMQCVICRADFYTFTSHNKLFFFPILDMCPDLVDPEGGRLVILTRKSVGGTAGFICNFGYELVGAATLTCQANGMWSAPPPVCMSAGGMRAN